MLAAAPRPWPRRARSALARQIMPAAMNHRDMLPRCSRPLIYVHVSKSAGSAMCRLARAAGERVAEPSFNCNMAADDAYDKYGRSKHPGAHRMSCAKRALHFAHGNYTWTQFNIESPCPDKGRRKKLATTKANLLGSEWKTQKKQGRNKTPSIAMR